MSDENWLKEREQVSPFDITVPDLPVLQRWPPVQQNFRRRETLPTWVSILLIFLAIALIGVALGLILFPPTAQSRGPLHTQATAIALTTVQAPNTAQAKDQATAKLFAPANPNFYAIATAQPRATATATATV